MKYIYILAAAIGVAAAQSVSQLFTALPPCALACTIPPLLSANCSLTTVPTIASCLCPSVEVQRNISSCVQAGCNHTEQVVVVATNNILCDGFPIQSRSEELEITAIVLLAITIPFVILRICSRILVMKKLLWDDWTLAAASVLLMSTLAIQVLMARKGFGRHIWNLNPLDIPLLQQSFYITQIFYVCVQILTKISLLVCFLRIFSQPWFRRTTIAAIVLIGAHGVIYIFLVAFQCLPVQSIWDPTVPTTQCLNRTALISSGAGFSIFEDFLILILPIPCVQSVKLKVGKRVILAIMFSIGSFACITSMIRLKHLIGFGDFTDSSWDNVDTSIWSAIELTTAVICACLPALRPILKQILPKIFGRMSSNKTSASPRGFLVSDMDVTQSQITDGETGLAGIGSRGGGGKGTKEQNMTKPLKSHVVRWLEEEDDQVKLVDLKKTRAPSGVNKPLPTLPR